MIKVNYYLNGQILFSDEWETIYDKSFVKNCKIKHDNMCYIVNNCYYDLLENVISVVITPKIKFSRSQ